MSDETVEVIYQQTETIEIVEPGPKGDPGTSAIQDDGVDVPERTILDFAGPGVTITDDEANDRIIITIYDVPGDATVTFAKLAAALVDNDPSLTANSALKLATQQAVKAYTDSRIAASDAVVFKGAINCSSNPNYPAADAGHLYRVSVAGKIGGGSGVNVEIGDTLLCLADSTAQGTQAAVGSSWSVIQVNIDGAVIGPASATDSAFAQFNTTTGKLIKAAASAPPPPVDVQTFTSGTGSWTAPAAPAGYANYSVCEVIVIGGGGGGGSGRKGAAGSQRTGGASGAQGAYSRAVFPFSVLNALSPIAYSVGAGGGGGAAVSTNSTNGNPGSSGNPSNLGSVLRAGYGSGGPGGVSGTSLAGVQAPYGTQFGGLSGGSQNGSGLDGTGSCGSGGGGISAADTAGPGGNAPETGLSALVAGGAAGSGIGAAGNGPNGANAGPGVAPGQGGGGGGGGSSVGPGGTGGTGGKYGGGGGGGGAGINAVANSGAGGAGGDGLVMVICR